MKQVIVGLILMMGLGACGQTLAGVSRNIQTDAGFNEIILKDVRQAILLAEASNDILALKCWNYVEEFALAHTPADAEDRGKVVGVLSTYQKGRNIRRTVIEVKMSDKFRLECGPMLTDTMGALGRLGIRIAL